MELHAEYWPCVSKSSGKIILLHGLGGRGSLWRPVCASLEKHFDLLAPDQRGHGKSLAANDPLQPSLEQMARDLGETVARRSFTPAWIIGHSMGVRTALYYAKLFPAQCRGLVLIDLGLSGALGGGMGLTLRKLIESLPEQGFLDRTEARSHLTAQCQDPSIVQYLMAVGEIKDGRFVFPFQKKILLSIIHQASDSSYQGLSILQTISKIPIPTLILRGEKSLVYPLASFEEEKNALKQFPSVQFKTIAGTGHGLPFEKRQEFISELLQFTAEASPS